jgi:hypothetical protein
MKILFLQFSTVLAFGLVPLVSVAADEKPIKTVEQNKSLQRTEQRLKALIEAAANQDLIHVAQKSDKPDLTSSTHVKSTAVKRSKICIAQDVFGIPTVARANTYEDLLMLKRDIVIGPDQLDTAKAQTLAQAYLGLGFGEEALVMAASLHDPERTAISIMAKILMGIADEDDAAFMKTQAECFDAKTNVWHVVMQDIYTPLSAAGIDSVIKQISALPKRLQNILGQHLGIKAVRTNDIKTAKAVYNILLEALPKQPDTHQVILSTDLHFFRALLALKSEPDLANTSHVRTLKIFAKKEGPYQAYALQALSDFFPKGDILYPGYIQDLDATVHTYSAHPIGKQALAQKITYLAKNFVFHEAINLTKRNFTVGDTYFEKSIDIIGKDLLSALTGTDANEQIRALDALINEGGFFAYMKDNNALKQAGLRVSAQLELPTLAAKIMPMDTWKNLNVDTVNILALSYSSDKNNQAVLAYFPQFVFEQAAFKAQEIDRAFVNRNLEKANDILQKSPDNTTIENAFITSSWNNNYWSVASRGLEEMLRTKPREDGNPLFVKQQLAATLGATSPLLFASSSRYGMKELEMLQGQLDKELRIFRTYIRSGETTEIGKSSG